MTGNRKVFGVGASGMARQGSVFADRMQGLGGQSYLYRPRRAVYVLFDTFIGSDGTRLDQHKPDIAPPGVTAWEPMTATGVAPTDGSVTIQGNKAAIADDQNGVMIDTSLSDADIQFDLTCGTASVFVGIVRGLSSGNFLGLRFRQVNALVELRAWTGGTPATIGAAQPITLVNGITYAFQIRAEEDRVTLWQNGVQILNQGVATTWQTETKQGFGVLPSSKDERFDNFRVAPISGSTPEPVL